MEVQKDLSDELDQANLKFAALSDEFQRNMSILRHSHERELTLLNAEDIAALFRNMIKGLRDSYGLEKVTVVLADPDHDVRHLLVAGGTNPEDLPGLQFVEALTGLAPQYIALRRPWLGPFKASDHSLLFPGKSNISSMAMIPLSHKGALLGSINFGSADESRFTREHATDFFAHLGTIASFALENVVNRARLLRSGFTDVLTGWNNRRYLQVRLLEELARARRDAGSLVCLMLDIDHFKNVNDTYGHATPCCANWRSGLSRRCASATSPPAMVGKNSSCCCRGRRSNPERCWRNAYARQSQRTPSQSVAATASRSRRPLASQALHQSATLMI